MRHRTYYHRSLFGGWLKLLLLLILAVGAFYGCRQYLSRQIFDAE